ncbi:DUF305 domain-containing protein [Nocardiopsis sp. L17-MgMaSL7]|uniref:DUF305 domain-containing protein n=1 Tax=Nocardiopsis sp. L17-MgMaSL7 TaxID=1938893 RepID=UPI000D71B45D|nr:DUF305 domain-containing protein [Nocardiopsis sp. L17-MgMaSL7]PWV50281.1 uncharacterized protein (DUF305 family) [Nocardiopsis sp. L17-MgMaSL7]
MTSYQRALKQRALTTAAAALATALFATACGDTGGDTADTTSESEEQVAEHNDADVMFAQMMIPHHEQAVTMADLADTRAGNEVEELAVEIRDAQGPEIEQMETLLDSWGADRESEMDHSDMDGMLTEEQMTELEGAEGERFDTLFLEFMVLHHKGAVDMARTELDDGVNPEARELAQEIIDAQESEIQQMNELLGVEDSGEDGAEATEEGDHSEH